LSIIEDTGIFKSPLWRSVFALVGLLTFNSLTLDFVWLLYVSYNSLMNKWKRCSDGDGCVLT